CVQHGFYALVPTDKPEGKHQLFVCEAKLLAYRIPLVAYVGDTVLDDRNFFRRNRVYLTQQFHSLVRHNDYTLRQFVYLFYNIQFVVRGLFEYRMQDGDYRYFKAVQ